MKHLENYGVQELNARELKFTDGGNPVINAITEGTTYGEYGANGIGYAVEAGVNAFVMSQNITGLAIGAIISWWND